MRTHALRLYGKHDLRHEHFDLPPLGEGEILAEVVCNSICMSDYKATALGGDHQRVPCDVADNPIIMGHEFSGVIVETGPSVDPAWQPGQRFGQQPAILLPEDPDLAPGYSFPHLGGHAKYVIFSKAIVERGCVLPYAGEAFFMAALAEPLSCVIGAFRSQYHTRRGSYEHIMGLAPQGRLAIFAGGGPMGLAAVDYALHGPMQPSVLVVTDIDENRLARAAQIFPPAAYKARGTDLHFVDTRTASTEDLRALSGGTGFDDIIIFAPVAPVIEQASDVLGLDGCLNFFAGPKDKTFKAPLNFYNVHYAQHHILGSTGGTTGDLSEALDLMGAGCIDPSFMVTEIGGIDAAAETTLTLPELGGGKKLIYTDISMPLTKLADLEARGVSDPLCAELAKLVAANNGLWSAAAEAYLLAHAPRISEGRA